MSDDYNDFHSAHSDGTLPNDEVKGSVRFKHAILWEVDLLTLGIGATQKSGSWILELLAPDGEVLFRQKVTLTLMLVSLGVPGLMLFTWNYVKEVFETSIIGGAEVTPETIGSYLLGGTAQSEQGLLDPASGQDNTDLTATIITDWFSPVYLFEIPIGAKLHVTQDSWGMGSSSRSEWAFAFGEARARERVDALCDPYGQLLIAADEHNNGSCFFNIADGPEFRHPLVRGVLTGLAPAIVREPDGTLIFAAIGAEGFIEQKTRNYFLTHEPVTYPSKDDPATFAPVALWPKSATMATLIKYQEGRASLAVVGGEVQFRLSGGSVGDAVRVCAALRGLSYGLVADSDGTLRVFSSQGLPVALSRNAGATWEVVSADG